MTMHVRHEVRLLDAHAHLLLVSSTFSATDGETLPSPLEVVMPVWTPGSYLVREFARHIERPSAHADDRELPVTKVRKNAWHISHSDARTVTFRYELYCNDLSVRTNHIDDTHLYINGAPTFLFAAHAPSVGATVALTVPEQWEVHTALPHIGQNQYVAQSYDELVDSPIHAGASVTRRFFSLGAVHEVAAWGDVGALDWEAFERDVARIVQTEANLFDGSLPYTRYVLLLLLTGRQRGGLEHRNSAVLAVSPTCMGERKAKLDALSLVAHEMLHLWNIKRIRPSGLWPYRYEEENYSRELWWFEGATSYFDWRVLLLAGLCTPEEYLQHLAEEIGRLLDTPGRFVQSVREASFDAWVKLYRLDENSVNSTVSYYLKGEVLCALLDLRLRLLTGGQRGLDTVLGALWRAYGVPEKPVPEGSIPKFIEQVMEVPIAQELTAWVDGREELPIADLCAASGLLLAAETSDKEPRGSLGLQLRVSDGHVLVSSVLRGRAGHRAGIHARDELLAIDEHRIDSGRLDSMLCGHAPGAQVRVLLSRDDVLRTVDVTLDAAAPEKWTLKIDPKASNEQRALLQGWLGAQAAR